jgi:Putative auto-transporter adhesin, head GIN domain
MPPPHWRSRRAVAAGTVRLAAAGLLIAVAAAPVWGLGVDVKGSGNVVKTSRSVTGLTGIALEAPVKVTVVQGTDTAASEGVVIETDDNVAPLIETVVERGQLVIRFARGTGSVSTKVLNVIVNARTIEQLAVGGSGTITSAKLQSAALKCSIGGSGDIRIAQLQAGNLRVTVAGSGTFEAAGRADEIDASIAGSGDIKAGNLAAERIKLGISGSGDAVVRANSTLNVSIAGSGDVAYYGNARVTQALAGSGKVRRVER